MFKKLVRVVSAPVILSLLGAALYSFAAEREKAEEGRYAVLRRGGLVQGTEHAWTIWRLPGGGYELEDHFQVDKTALGVGGAFLSPDMPLSPEFRKSLENAVEPSDLRAVFSADGQLLSLIVTGTKFNGKAGEGLKCKSASSSVECEGTQDKAKLRLKEPRELFWWYSMPMLLHAWLGPSQGGLEEAGPRKAVLLHFGPAPKLGKETKPGMRSKPGMMVWGDRPALEAADVSVTHLGLDKLVLGDKSFNAQKHKLELKAAQGDALTLTAWTDAKGVILAVSDAATPDDLIALIEYKKL